MAENACSPKTPRDAYRNERENVCPGDERIIQKVVCLVPRHKMGEKVGERNVKEGTGSSEQIMCVKVTHHRQPEQRQRERKERI